jgi:hypothetical protein
MTSAQGPALPRGWVRRVDDRDGGDLYWHARLEVVIREHPGIFDLYYRGQRYFPTESPWELFLSCDSENEYIEKSFARALGRLRDVESRRCGDSATRIVFSFVMTTSPAMIANLRMDDHDDDGDGDDDDDDGYDDDDDDDDDDDNMSVITTGATWMSRRQPRRPGLRHPRRHRRIRRKLLRRPRPRPHPRPRPPTRASARCTGTTRSSGWTTSGRRRNPITRSLQRSKIPRRGCDAATRGDSATRRRGDAATRR